MTECSVCYCRDDDLILKCGHSFCYQCTRDWYQNTECFNCPLCRQNIKFDGLNALKSSWDRDPDLEDVRTDINVLEVYKTFKKLSNNYTISGFTNVRYIVRIDDAEMGVINFTSK